MTGARLVLLMALAACDADEKDQPVDTGPDTDSPDDPDPVIDVDGTLAQANPTAPVDDGAPGEAIRLTPATAALDPAGDHDFYEVTLTAGTPYHLWADTGPNIRCDTVLRLYGPSAAVPASTSRDGEACVLDEGDQYAVSDDMILRYRLSDPGLVFVPPESGAWRIEVLNYDEAVGLNAVGGAWCQYDLYAMRREATEVECNDLAEVRSALEDAGGPSLPADADSPAVQPTLPNLFAPCAEGVVCSEEISGWLPSAADDDVWRYRFGDLGEGVRQAWWTFSLWPTVPSAAPVRMELLDHELNVVARTDNPVPDGSYGFVNDVGILYPVTPFSTWYLRISRTDGIAVAPNATSEVRRVTAAPATWREAVGAHPEPLPPKPAPRQPQVAASNNGAATSGAFYVGTSQGYGHGIIDCGSGDEAFTGWESESDPAVLEALTENQALPKNDSFNDADAVRFCQVGDTNLFVASIAGYFDPNGDPVQFVPLDNPNDTGVELDDVELRCGDGTPEACPDREIFAIRGTSGAGQIRDERIMLSVQSATVGSFANADVYLFTNSERIRPFGASTDQTVDPAVAVQSPDPDLDLRLPNDAETVFVVVQPRVVHPTDRRANMWFMRILIEKLDPTSATDETPDSTLDTCPLE
jgi:hypothetical protein